MSTSQLQVTPRPAAVPERVHVLVATGPSPSGRRSIQGELVWFPPPCGRKRCSCTEDFTGARSRGLTEVARVSTLSSPRAVVRRVLAAAMCSHCVPPMLAGADADRLLAVAASLPVGTLVRRTPAGEIVPLPPGSAPVPYGAERTRPLGDAR